MTGIDYREILNMMNSAYEQSNPTKKMRVQMDENKITH